MKVRNLISATIAVSLAAAFTAASPQPARAFHFSIIGGQCFNPAGQLIPLPGALSNPHCAFPNNPPNDPPNDPPNGKKKHHSNRSSNTGKIVVGCIMGSALGLIVASNAKGTANGSPMRWMSQKEYEDLKVKVPYPLTHGEVWPIALTCGLATPFVIANFHKEQPAVVKTKY